MLNEPKVEVFDGQPNDSKLVVTMGSATEWMAPHEALVFALRLKLAAERALLSDELRYRRQVRA